MPISIYQASVPVFVRGLGVLSTLLRKGEEHAGNDAAALIEARLAHDMLPLSGQVQRASDTSKLALERLTGVPSPKMEDDEKTFPELQARIEKTIRFIDGFTQAQLADSAARKIELKFGDFKPSFSVDSFLLTFALPNFYFHVTTAYDILRHKGVAVGKRDFLGKYEG